MALIFKLKFNKFRELNNILFDVISKSKIKNDEKVKEFTEIPGGSDSEISDTGNVGSDSDFENYENLNSVGKI